MPEIELKTAKFFAQQDEGANATDTMPEDSASGSCRTKTTLERTVKWISIGTAGLLAVCVTLLAVPYVTGIHLPKSANPVDWMLWFGGAKSDQTLEKALRDSAARNQQEWVSKFQQSPMYQFKGIQSIDMNKLNGMPPQGQRAVGS